MVLAAELDGFAELFAAVSSFFVAPESDLTGSFAGSVFPSFVSGLGSSFSVFSTKADSSARATGKPSGETS